MDVLVELARARPRSRAECFVALLLDRAGVALRPGGRRCSSEPVRRGILFQTKNIECSGWGWSWATMARPMAMMAATMPSIRSVGLFLAGLRLPAGSWATGPYDPMLGCSGNPRNLKLY